MPTPHLRVVAQPGNTTVDGVSTARSRLPERANAIRFSESVRCVVALARRGGLEAPVFRSPPGRDGVDRTIRRRGDQPPVVAIARSGRPLAAVQSDVIEAIVVANDLDGHRADRFRRAAWAELDAAGLLVDREPGSQVSGRSTRARGPREQAPDDDHVARAAS